VPLTMGILAPSTKAGAHGAQAGSMAAEPPSGPREPMMLQSIVVESEVGCEVDSPIPGFQALPSSYG